MLKRQWGLWWPLGGSTELEMPHYLLLRLYLLTDQSQPPGDIKIGHTFSYLCRPKWKLTSSDLQNLSPWQRHSCQGGHFEQRDPDGQAPRFQDSASLSNISSEKCQCQKSVKCLPKISSNICQKCRQIFGNGTTSIYFWQNLRQFLCTIVAAGWKLAPSFFLGKYFINFFLGSKFFPQLFLGKYFWRKQRNKLMEFKMEISKQNLYLGSAPLFLAWSSPDVFSGLLFCNAPFIHKIITIFKTAITVIFSKNLIIHLPE